MGNSVLEFSMDDLLKINLDGEAYQNKIILVKMDGRNRKKPEFKDGTFIRLDAFSIFLARKGEIDITIDDATYHLSDNLLMDIMDLHAVKDLRLSPDFRGYHLVIERNIFAEIMLKSPHMPASYIASHQKRPILKLDDEKAGLLEEILIRIGRNIRRTDHAWHRDIILNELRSFLLEMNNIIYQVKHGQVEANPPGKNELLFLFIQLLFKHCKTEHTVAFYARELCVTPEYLTRIMKSFSGKTVNQWISESLIREAEIALRNPELSVQQVSDLLNFSDQSSFGKFFKKHRGISPLAFKRHNG